MDSDCVIDNIKVLDIFFERIVAGNIDHPVMPFNNEGIPLNNTCVGVGV